jgi:hypothetical protein
MTIVHEACASGGNNGENRITFMLCFQFALSHCIFALTQYITVLSVPIHEAYRPGMMS